jgi:hypothetical protein
VRRNMEEKISMAMAYFIYGYKCKDLKFIVDKVRWRYDD